MKHCIIVCALVALAWTSVSTAQAGELISRRVARSQPWHGAYYNPAVGGAPLALVVPPTAERQVSYSWGVTGTEVRPIRHQYDRRAPGFPGNFGFAPTPRWPGHTDQFGVYYVRGPWK